MEYNTYIFALIIHSLLFSKEQNSKNTILISKVIISGICVAQLQFLCVPDLGG